MAAIKKEFLTVLWVFISIEIAIYLAFSFYWMDLNAANWGMSARGGFSFLSLVVLVVIALIEIINKLDQ